MEDVQYQGYKLLREWDRKIFYSSDVIFAKDLPIEPLNSISEKYVDF